MTIKDRFNKYKGLKVKHNKYLGIIVGYYDNTLVAKVIPGSVGRGSSWIMRSGSHRENCTNNDKYFTLPDNFEDLIIYESPEYLAEKYINDHFKDINDNTKEIYINIFIEGYKYKNNNYA